MQSQAAHRVQILTGAAGQDVTYKNMLPFWVISPPSLSIPAPFTKQTNEATSEIADLLTLAQTQQKAGQHADAIASFRAAINLIDQQAPDSIELKGEALYGLGDTYMESAAYSEAIPMFEAAIALFAEPNHTRQTNLTDSDYANYLIFLTADLGQAHEYIAQFGTALEYYQQVLTPAAIELIDPYTHSSLLIHRGIVETEIGQYSSAEATLQQATELSQQLESTEYLAYATSALAWTYEQQTDLTQALNHYQAALSLYQQIGNRSEEILTLSNIGAVQLKQNNLTAAQNTLNQALALTSKETPNYQKTVLFDSLGILYQQQGNFEQAWSSYRQAIALSRNSDKVSEIGALINLGNLMESQANPQNQQLAIFFYKQAIARIETIRQDLHPLSSEKQKRYIRTVEDTYRHLANLLLQQNRTEEALQILDLLKIQEVKTYLQSSQTNEPTILSLLSPTEADLANTFNALPPNFSLADFAALPEVTALSQPLPSQTHQSEAPDTVNTPHQPAIIQSLQATLKAQPVNTAAIYPLILEDRLEIVLITAENTPIHISQPVTETELITVINTLQNKLKTNTLAPTAEAQQLYSWLIRPLEEILTQQEIENIIYLPDGALRYIPIAALHDGNQWFVQKYQSHNITAASIDDLNRTNNIQPSVLAGAFTDEIPAYSVQVGQQQYSYQGLSAARQEINNLLALLPGTTALFDQDFSPVNTLSAVENHQIVHLATHAKFLPGQPEDSFVLFGDGSTVNMRDISQWELPNIDLVVFSACQTAVSVEGDGKEILGLGFQVQQTGAGAAIAALWSVDDTATAVLMNQFYIALSEGKTKAAALRHAQLKLIEEARFQHPHDWAAFILIGNGR